MLLRWAARAGTSQRHIGGHPSTRTSNEGGRSSSTHPCASWQHLNGRQLAAGPLRQHHAPKGAHSERV